MRNSECGMRNEKIRKRSTGMRNLECGMWKEKKKKKNRKQMEQAEQELYGT